MTYLQNATLKIQNYIKRSNDCYMYPSVKMAIQVDLSLPKYAELAAQLEADYYNICDQFNAQLSESNRATLHTASGEFIQIRTKDSKPYHPIYSNIYGREISDKNRAFYFKKDFMKYIVSLED